MPRRLEFAMYENQLELSPLPPLAWHGRQRGRERIWAAAN